MSAGTSVRLYKPVDMQYCGECLHCVHNPNFAYCLLGKWTSNQLNEYFFYDPKSSTNEKSVVDKHNQLIWEYSLLCKDFQGIAFQCVEMKCSIRTGESDGFSDYMIKAISKSKEINYSREVHFFVDMKKTNPILEWLMTINIM